MSHCTISSIWNEEKKVTALWMPFWIELQFQFFFSRICANCQRKGWWFYGLIMNAPKFEPQPRFHFPPFINAKYLMHISDDFWLHTYLFKVWHKMVTRGIRGKMPQIKIFIKKFQKCGQFWTAVFAQIAIFCLSEILGNGVEIKFGNILEARFSLTLKFWPLRSFTWG